MGKAAPETELTFIEHQITAFPHGVAISELESALVARGIVLNRRTLLRRLRVLVDQGRIFATGNLKGRLYLPPGARGADTATDQESPIPLSPAGVDVRRSVRQPIQRREPVGYRREFLLTYPEQGPYLDDATRGRLHRAGRLYHESAPAGTVARQLMARLLIDLSWASSRLEGNTYSLLETERLVAFGQAADGKDALETQMILNHKQAIEFIVESAEEIGFNRYTIQNLHALLSDNLLRDPDACGRLRRIAVGIGGSVYSPLSTPQLLDEYFQRMLDIASRIEDPFEQAFFALAHFSYLQPFEDVNKRVARLAANIPLVRNNLCPLSFVDVPQELYVEGILGIYELNRIELLRDVFVWGYERSVKRYMSTREEVGEPDPLRLKHRELITEIIRETVLRGETPDHPRLKTRISSAEVPEQERQRLIELMMAEFVGLHTGNIARFRLRPAEFAAWRQKFPSG